MKEGYTKACINEMTVEEYDYISALIFEKISSGKGVNPFTGGI